ncbi:MAG: peptidoglycan D,D-transpeptidase FtsI family protein [Deltaproteobacteria bacterium]
MATPSTGRRRPSGRRGGLLGSPKRARNGCDGRIRLLRFLFIVFLVLVGGKAVALASSSQHLTELAQRQQLQKVELPAPRGAILDRNGAELAVGKPQQTVYATPYLLDDPEAAAEELCDALQINRRRDRRDVAEKLSDAESGFAYVARKVDPVLARAALKLDLPGVGSYAEEKRTYPLKGTAAQVVGFAGMDNIGLFGIELLYDEELSGKAGSETVVRDPAGHALKTVAHVAPQPGENVYLTLDREIQFYAEDVLEETIRRASAKAATAIVMDPRTGEVLVMANVFRQGFHGFGKDTEARKNRAVEDAPEPGSIFKLVTISGALADGTVKPSTTFSVPWKVPVADRTIEDSHVHATEEYSVREIMQESSNVGAYMIAKEMEAAGLYKWVKAFGFGKKTGIEFPVESEGIVHPVEEWSGSSIGNIPMGQGVAATAIQMASAFSTVAYNGWQVKPRLVAQVGTEVHDTVEKHRVIPARVARQVRDMLRLAVEEGTGGEARIPGYDVGGKTGTAEIPLKDGSGYAKGIYTSSFIGMVPAGRPRLVVLVTVESTPGFGGVVAAPAFKDITSFALQHLEIAP